MNNENQFRYNCSICGDIFVSEYDVIEHKAQAHAGSNIDEDEGMSKCKWYYVLEWFKISETAFFILKLALLDQ